MNERIRELIKQHGVDITIDAMGYGEGNFEGLAELIVLECARIGELKEQGYVYGPEYSAGHYMKQHFGVGNGNT
jgi:hypothetical protein